MYVTENVSAASPAVSSTSCGMLAVATGGTAGGPPGCGSGLTAGWPGSPGAGGGAATVGSIALPKPIWMYFTAAPGVNCGRQFCIDDLRNSAINASVSAAPPRLAL